jgi:IstB-like ATP binding protein
MLRISPKNIWQQIKADLIGKDSHRGITLTYAWLANQFGHFGIGYILTVIIYFGFKSYFDKPMLTAPLIVVVCVIVFELYNFLAPLLKKSESQKPFKPAWLHIAFDTATDVLFFSFGAFSTSLLSENSILQWIALIILLLLLYPIYYWYKTKMFQQNACFPFQLRLSQWDYKINEADKQKILDFITLKIDQSKITCLIILGNHQSIKTNLAVSIGNEYSIKHHFCYYSTLVKLVSTQPINENSKKSSLWNWFDSELIIIDDLSYDSLNGAEVISPKIVLERFEAKQFVHKFNYKKSIWVPGITNDTNGWIEMLTKLGIDKSAIATIYLD